MPLSTSLVPKRLWMSRTWTAAFRSLVFTATSLRSKRKGVRVSYGCHILDARFYRFPPVFFAQALYFAHKKRHKPSTPPYELRDTGRVPDEIPECGRNPQ